MGYHDKNYTNKNHDVILLANTIEEYLNTFKQDMPDLRELSMQLKNLDLSVSTRRGFQQNIDIFSNVYRYFVKSNVVLLYLHSNNKGSVYDPVNLSMAMKYVSDKNDNVFVHSESVTGDMKESLRFLNGYGCSIVSLISLASSCNKRFSMLPMFKLFLEDYNSFMDIGSYYSKMLRTNANSRGEYDTGKDENGYSYKYNIAYDATEKHLEEKAQIFGKLDYYTINSLEAIKNGTINANTEFSQKPKSFFTWENEYEFSVLNKYLGPEVVIKITLLLALNVLSVYKTYYK